MDKRTKVMIAGAVAVGIGLAAPSGIHSFGAAPGDQMNQALHWLVTGGGLTTILAFAAKYLPGLGLSPQASTYAIEAINVGRLGVYAKLYRESKDDAEKASLRITAKGVSDGLFEDWFPVPTEPKV